jgi:hypothetical protein
VADGGSEQERIHSINTFTSSTGNSERFEHRNALALRPDLAQTPNEGMTGTAEPQF